MLFPLLAGSGEPSGAANKEDQQTDGNREDDQADGDLRHTQGGQARSL